MAFCDSLLTKNKLKHTKIGFSATGSDRVIRPEPDKKLGATVC